MSDDELGALFPSATADERRMAEALLRLARSGFRDPPQAPLDRLPLDFLFRNRVLAAIPTSWVPDWQRDAVESKVERILLVQMQLEWSMLEAVQVLADAGIDSRVLKGMASCFLDYPQPELRHSGDVDLLIPSDRLRDAAEALAQRGHELLPNQTFAHWSRGLTMRNSTTGRHIDLHSRPVDRRMLRAAPGLFDDPGEPLLDGRAMALRGSLRLVHACAHVVATSPTLRRLSGLIDVATIGRAPGDLSSATQLRVTSVAGLALRAAGLEAVHFPSSPSWLERRAFLSRSGRRIDRELWKHGIRLATRGPQALAFGKSRARKIDHGRHLQPTDLPRGETRGGPGTWQQNPDVRTRLRGDRLLMYEPRSGTAIVIDGSGPAIWNCLGRPSRLEDLTRSLRVTGTATGRPEQEVVEFVDELAAIGFVRSNPATVPNSCPSR